MAWKHLGRSLAPGSEEAKREGNDGAGWKPALRRGNSAMTGWSLAGAAGFGRLRARLLGVEFGRNDDDHFRGTGGAGFCAAESE